MNDTVPPSRAAILLVQLGTPDKPEVPEVRRYLREFLSDRRVVEQSPLIWWPILYSVVLTRRPKESAEKYRSIWTKAGSPLLVNTKLVAEALQDELNKRGPAVGARVLRTAAGTGCGLARPGGRRGRHGLPGATDRERPAAAG